MSSDSFRRPNVLCFVSDQQRADHLGCAGDPLLQTPCIDRLAASGMRFRRCYVNEALCMPSRASLFTGQRSHVHGVHDNRTTLDPRLPTFTGALARAGYRTHGVGKFHLSVTSLPAHTRAACHGDPGRLNPREWPESREMWKGGYIGALPAPYYGLQSALGVGGHGDYVWGDYKNWLKREAPGVAKAIDDWIRAHGEDWTSTGPSRLPAELHHSHWIADRVIDFLREQRYSEQPFFCWCSFPDPHHPYHAPEPYHSLYDPADMPTPARREGELENLPPHMRRMVKDYERTPEIMARTYGMINNIDANVGRVLNELARLGLREDTIVIYLADHGDLMGDHWQQRKGAYHFDGLIRVPFIWSWPGHITPGSVNDGIVSLLDLAPTILDLCGVAIPQGSEATEPLRPLHRQLPPWPGHSLRSILEGRQETVRHATVIDGAQETCEGLCMRTLVTERYRLTWYAGQRYGEMFDLQEDSQELHNLWSEPGCQTLRQELTAELLEQVLTEKGHPASRLGCQ